MLANNSGLLHMLLHRGTMHPAITCPFSRVHGTETPYLVGASICRIWRKDGSIDVAFREQQPGART